MNKPPNILPQLPSIPFEDLLSIPESVRSLISAQEEIIKQLLEMILSLQGEVQELRNKLNINSSNSNLPPSSDRSFSTKPPKQQKKKSKKDSNGKKKAKHPGTAQKLQKPTQEFDCPLTVCPHCGGSTFTNQRQHTHQHFELRPNPIEITHCHIHTGKCACCGRAVSGEIPREFWASYGPRLEAFVAYLDSRTGITRRELEEVFQDALGIPISQGAIQNTTDRVSAAILPYYEAIGDSIRKSWYAHVDETSWRTHGPLLGKSLHWLWTMTNHVLAYFRIDPHRSEDAFKALIKDWIGVLISDALAIYRKWPYGRQACLAHLKREICKLEESLKEEESRCGKSMGATLRTLLKMADSPPTEGQLRSLKAKITSICKKFGSIRGKAGALARRLKDDLSSLTTFLSHPLIEKTNNHAERQIRSAVCQRKISIGSAAEKGERYIERTLSLRKTCALSGVSYFTVLTDAVRSFRENAKPNLLWIRKLGWRSFHSKEYPFLLQIPVIY